MEKLSLMSIVISKLEKILIPSALLENEDTASLVRPLVVLCVVGIILVLVNALVWAFISPLNAILSIIGLIPEGLTLLFIRWRRVRLAKGIFLISAWIVVTIAMLGTGGTRAISFEAYSVIVMLAALLSGWWLAFCCAIITIVMGFAVAMLDPVGAVLVPVDTPLSAWLTHSVIMLFIIGAAYFVVRQTRQALLQVRNALAEREKAVKALKASEERYRMLSETISDYAYAYNVDEVGNIEIDWVTVESFKNVTGYYHDESIPGGIYGLYQPEDRDRTRSDVELVIRGQEVSGDYQIITKQGETRWLNIRRYPVWDEDKKRVVKFYGAAQDITERKLAEEAVRESENKFRTIFELATYGIVIQAKGGIVTTANPAFLHAIGYSLEQIQGKNIFDPANFGIYRDVDAVQKLSQELIRTGRIMDRELTVYHADGHPITILISSQLIQLSGEPHVLTIGTDITERKQNETHILNLNAELHQQTLRLSALNEIARSVTSLADLNTVLHNILQQLQIVLPVDGFTTALYDIERNEVTFPLVYDNGQFWNQAPETFERDRTGLRAQLLNSRKPVLLNRSDDEIKARREVVDTIGDSSQIAVTILAAPLLLGNKVIGAIVIHSYKHNMYTDEHVAMLEGAAYQIAIAINNAQLYGFLQKELEERKKIEESLRESEEKFRTIFEMAPYPTMILQINGQLADINDTFLQGIGMSREQVLGRTLEEVGMSIGGSEYTKEISGKLLTDGRVNHEEVLVTYPNNKIGTFLFSSQYLKLQDEPHILTIAINITERKQAEEAVKRSEAHLRALLNATTDVAFLMALDGTLLTINEAMARPMGRKIEEMIGRNGFDYLEPNLHAQRYSYFERVTQSGEPARWEDHSSTGWWDNSVYPVQSPAGSVEAFGVYSRDITEQKRLEAELKTYTNELEKLVDERTNALRRANEQLELILHTTSDALAFAQPNGDIVMTNPAFLAMFDNRAGHSIEDILAAVADNDQVETIGNALVRVVYNNERQHLEAQIVSKEGREQDVDLTLIPVSAMDDEFRNGILLSGHDITQLKAIERHKARFVADALHDLATPITGLTTRLYLLQRSPERLTDHVRSLENQLKHLRNLLEDLRTLSQMDRGQIALQMELRSINELAQRIFDTYEPVALEKNQSLKLRVDPALPYVSFDERQIERVMVNLVSNAVNYTPGYKEITIETGVEQQSVFVRVSDQGIGISAEDLPRIFERFYRTDEAREQLSTGTGLGLAITKETIEKHGGSVTVTSEPGQGSTFTVRLPLRN